MRAPRPAGRSARWIITLVLVWLGAFGSVLAQVQLPSPDDRSVHDFAGVLTAEAVSMMERLHADLYQRAGVAIVVGTMPSLEDESIRAFGVRLATEWGVGDAETDRGIVVVLALSLIQI